MIGWVKRWPTILFEGGDFFNRKRDSIAHSISLSAAHSFCCDCQIVENDVKSQVFQPPRKLFL